MMKNKKPEIRFKGFSEEWEAKELKDIAIIRTGYPFDSKDFDKNGEYLVITNGNIQNDLPYVDSSLGNRIDLKNSFSLSEYLLNQNDILVTMDGTVGRTAKVVEQKQILAQRVGRLTAKIEAEFLYQFLNTGEFFKEMSLIAHGGTIKHISLNEIGDYVSFIPSFFEEQTQIGNFFKNLDNLISLHQRKYEKLGILKKAMLEKMFPKNGADVPEIRFKGFSGAWEERKLGEILTEMRRSIILEDSKTYELVTVKRRNQGVVSRGLMKGKDILVKNYFEVREGDYIISKRQVIHGANGIVPKSLDGAIVSNEYLVCVENENITAEYLAIISNLPDMYRKFFLSSYGVDIEKLVFDVEDWKKRSIVIPSLTEQKRITGFFKNLDSLLTLHKGELDKLKNLKKALLEKMFV